MESRYSNTQPLLYEISGEEVLKDRIPLYEVMGSLREYMNIIDRSYLTLSGRDRLSKKDREKYKIMAYQFNPGSLRIDMAIELLEIFQQSMLFIMPVGASGLWNLTKASYDFVKLINELRNNDIEPQIIEDNSTNLYVKGNNNQIIVNPTLAFNADKIEESVATISNLIKPGEVDLISLKDSFDEGLVITEKEKKLFNPETTIDEIPEVIFVRIYRLDTESRRGKLHIIDGLETDDLSFQIVGDQAIGPYIDALKADKVRVRILRESSTSVSGKQYIKRLQILDLPDLNSLPKKLL